MTNFSSGDIAVEKVDQVRGQDEVTPVGLG
jgi:hypothetical protein